MTEDRNSPPLSRPEGWVRLLAETPPMRELIEFAEDLPAAMPDDEKRALIRDHATKVGLSLRGIVEQSLPSGTPPGILDMDAEAVLHALVTAWFQQNGPRQIGDLIPWVDQFLPWTDLIAGFALSKAMGEDGDNPMTLIMDGLVFDGVLGSKTEHPMPYVVAASSPKTTRPQHLRTYAARMREVFEGIPNPTGDTISFLAECVAFRNSVPQGLQPAEIAREMVYRDYPETRALTGEQFDAEWHDVYEDYHDQIRQALTRDLRRVTETSRKLSQDSD